MGRSPKNALSTPTTTRRAAPERAIPGNFLTEVFRNNRLTAYHKKQIARALKKGLGDHLAKDWARFLIKEISGEQLISRVNNYLMETEIKDDEIYFTSMDDFFDRY